MSPSVPAGSITPAEDDQVKPPDRLEEIYFASVGRNSKLLLNVPPGRDGLIAPADTSSLSGFAERLRLRFATDMAAGAVPRWTVQPGGRAEGEIRPDHPADLGILALEEDIRLGQRVARYSVTGYSGGEWRELSRGETIGYRKLDRIEPARLERIRLTIETAGGPALPVRLRLYGA